MKKFFYSVEDVMSGCSNSALMSHIATVLSIPSRNGAQWKFVSAVEDGEKYYAIFDMPIENSDVVFYRSSYGSPRIDRGHISTTKPVPVERCANF